MRKLTWNLSNCYLFKCLDIILLNRSRFVLVASSWSECIVTDSDGNAATCGGGLQVQIQLSSTLVITSVK